MLVNTDANKWLRDYLFWIREKELLMFAMNLVDINVRYDLHDACFKSVEIQEFTYSAALEALHRWCG